MLRKEGGHYRVLNTFLCEFGGLGCTIKLGKPVSPPGQKSIHLAVHTNCCTKGYDAEPGNERSHVAPSCTNNDDSMLVITPSTVRLSSSSPRPAPHH